MKRSIFLSAAVSVCALAQPTVAESQGVVSELSSEAASQFPSLYAAELDRARSFVDGMIAGDYVLPSGFSAADAMLGFNLFAAPYYVRLDPWPNLQAYWARLQERPAFQAAAAIEGLQTFYAQDFYEVPEDD